MTQTAESSFEASCLRGPAPQKDGCPHWAHLSFEQLRDVEIYLGNIPKATSWQSEPLPSLVQKSLYRSEQVFDEAKTELIFGNIVRRLQSEGFSPEQVVAFANSRIGYKGGPPYCSVAEVCEALGT